MDTKAVDEIFKALPHIQKTGARHIAFDFDEEADTLYISFEHPQNATDTDILEDGTFLRMKPASRDLHNKDMSSMRVPW